MPNLSPDVLGEFWYERFGITTEEWPEGYAILVHPDEYVEELLDLPEESEGKAPDNWYAYLILQVGNGEVRVEENPVHTTFRVTGWAANGKRSIEKQCYEIEMDKSRPKTAHEERTREKKREQELRQKRRETFMEAIEYAKHVARSM